MTTIDVVTFGGADAPAPLAELVLAQTGQDLSVITPLTADEAQELTGNIRNAAEVLWVLIAQAHAGQAWRPLGYQSWEAYVRGEFNMSRSRSYQILDQARVIAAIESAAPDGTSVHLSVAAARDLKGSLDEIVPELRQRTEGMSPRDASDAIDDYVDERRAPRPRQDDIEDYYEADTRPPAPSLRGNVSATDDDDDADNVDFEEYEPVAKAEPLLGPAGVRGGSVGAEPAGDVDVAKIRRNVNAAHDLYSSLSALSSLPEQLDEVVAIIPAERHAQIHTNLQAALANLNRFASLWNDADPAE